MRCPAQHRVSCLKMKSMKRFNPSLIIFYLLILLLRIIPSQSQRIAAVAASNHDDRSWLHSEVPGVGFRLRPDHGTVAVKLLDQAPVAVARVEGNEAYKRLWRSDKATKSEEDEVWQYNSWCPLYNSMTPQSVQNYLGYCRGNPDVDVMQDLLYALKDAVEAHLGHGICLINISLLDDILEHVYLTRLIDAALANLGLTQTLSEVKPSAHAMVLAAEGLYTDLPEDPGLLMLAIESRSSGDINLDLSLLDNAGSMIIRSQHNITGTVINPQCLDENVPVSCKKVLSQRQQTIREALKSIVMPPFGELPWAGEMPTAISRILIFGDSAYDKVLQEELLNLFGSKLLEHAVVQQPEYAVALGAAWQAFFRINAIDYDVEQPFWCCLRSAGKACPGKNQRVEI